MFSLICAWINGWVNNREAGDLSRQRAHYDVIVMRKYYFDEVHMECCFLGDKLQSEQNSSNNTEFVLDLVLVLAASLTRASLLEINIKLC